MFNKIKSYKQHPVIQQLQDVRSLGLIAFGVLALMVSWSTISAIQTNYGLQKQISALQQQNQVLELQNKNQQLTNQYYNTNQFLELAARQHFGKAAPDEKILLVPKSVALKYSVDLGGASKTAPQQSVNSVYQRNFQAWMNFFLHREQ